MKNKKSYTIKGKPIVDIYASYEGHIWIITEILEPKHEKMAHGWYKGVEADDSERVFEAISLKLLKSDSDWVSRVPKRHWKYCEEIGNYKCEYDEESFYSECRPQ